MKDTRTAWAQESDAKWKAVREEKEMKAKYSAVCAELEEAQKEIEDLKQSLWNANYHHASFRGATYDEAKDYADKLERG